MKRANTTHPRRQPGSVSTDIEPLAKAGGIGVNLSFATAVAEKLMAMDTVAFINRGGYTGAEKGIFRLPQLVHYSKRLAA
jgi:hypothetical protein